MRKTTFALASAVALMAVPAMASTVVLNGSFEEDPGVAGLRGNDFADLPTNSGNKSWDIWTDLPGWESTSGAGTEIQTDVTLGSIDAQEGNYYVELDSHNNSSIAQTIALDAGAYELSFYFSPRTRNEETNGITYGVNGVFSDTVTGPSADIAKGEWTEITYLFNIDTADDYDLVFAATGKNDSYGGLIDNISISAVPLPAPALLLMGGLGALGALRRRKRG